MKDFQGRRFIVTGAASGIGRALSVALSGAGARLVLWDKDPGGLQETAKACGGEGVFLRCVDVSDRTAVASAAKEAVRSLGGVEGLLNNAGVSSSGSILELTYETLRWTMDINFYGAVHCTEALLPELMKSGEAALVNVSSVYGLIGVPAQAAYCASKFAVRGYTEALRQDLRGTNVHVTLVFPGGVKTNIVRNSRSDFRLSESEKHRLGKLFEESLKTSPDEAARAILQGIQKKAPRVLIGKDARKIDLLVRLKPGSYDEAVAKAGEKYRGASGV